MDDKETEIEITQAMIEVGVSAFERLSESFDDYALVVAVYSAMESERLRVRE